MSDFVTPWTAELQASLSSTISRNLLKLMSVESKMPCNHLILYRPLLLLLSILLSIRVFSNELAVWIRCLKYWSFSSVVQFSHLVVSDSLRPHELQHRVPCPSLSPGACSNSCPLSWWCHPTISFSVIPCSCLQTSPASGSFLMSQFFSSEYWNFGKYSIFPMNIQDRFPLKLSRASVPGCNSIQGCIILIWL